MDIAICPLAGMIWKKGTGPDGDEQVGRTDRFLKTSVQTPGHFPCTGKDRAYTSVKGCMLDRMIVALSAAWMVRCGTYLACGSSASILSSDGRPDHLLRQRLDVGAADAEYGALVC